GLVLAFPVVLFQGYGFIRIYSSLERHLTNERHLSAQFYKHSTTDPLTGLPNRLLFSTLLNQAIARASRTGGGIAVLCLDVDRLKLVNDSLGHEGGDEVLHEVSRRLRISLRQADVLCRAGGDEFLVFIEGISTREQLASLLDRLFAELERPLQVMNTELAMT